MNYFLLIENKSFWQFDISDLIQVLVAIVPLLILFLTFRNERKNKRKELKEKTIILYNQLFNKLSKFNQYWINEFENKEEMVKSRISLSLDN